MLGGAPFFCQSPRDPCNFLSRKPRRGFNAPLSQSALPASLPPLVQRRLYYSHYFNYAQRFSFLEQMTMKMTDKLEPLAFRPMAT